VFRRRSGNRRTINKYRKTDDRFVPQRGRPFPPRQFSPDSFGYRPAGYVVRPKWRVFNSCVCVCVQIRIRKRKRNFQAKIFTVVFISNRSGSTDLEPFRRRIIYSTDRSWLQRNSNLFPSRFRAFSPGRSLGTINLSEIKKTRTYDRKIVLNSTDADFRQMTRVHIYIFRRRFSKCPAKCSGTEKRAPFRYLYLPVLNRALGAVPGRGWV